MSLISHSLHLDRRPQVFILSKLFGRSKTVSSKYSKQQQTVRANTSNLYQVAHHTPDQITADEIASSITVKTVHPVVSTVLDPELMERCAEHSVMPMTFLITHVYLPRWA